MTSTTGDRPQGACQNILLRRKGLTFIEVMVAVVVLTAGLVAIYRSFFIGVDYLDRLSCRLYALNLLESKIASVEKDLRSLKDVDVGPLVDTAVINNRSVEFRYEMNLKPVGSLLSVFSLDIAVSWEEHGRSMGMSRSAYFSGITSLAGGQGT